MSTFTDNVNAAIDAVVNGLLGNDTYNAIKDAFALIESDPLTLGPSFSGSLPATNVLSATGTNVVGQTQITAVAAAGAWGAGYGASSYTGAAQVSMGKLVWDGTAAWNTTASTQDSKARLYVTENGADKLALTAETNGNLIAENDLDIVGALSKGSGTFLIDHVLDPENKNLYHGFVEAPRYDLIYRGRAQLVNGKVTVSIDLASGLTRGTFKALTQNVQVSSLQNNETFDRVIGSVHGGQLTIESESPSSTATIDWVVIAERADPFIKSHKGTDADGHLITEVDKEDLDNKFLEDRVIEAKESADDTDEEVTEAQGKKGYVRHAAAYPDSPKIPKRRVRTVVPVVEEAEDQ